jgi:hypothetical protein
LLNALGSAEIARSLIVSSASGIPAERDQLPGSSLSQFVTDDDTTAARSLFEGIVEFCDTRCDDLFPLNH